MYTHTYIYIYIHMFVYICVIGIYVHIKVYVVKCVHELLWFKYSVLTVFAAKIMDLDNFSTGSFNKFS